MEPTRTPGLAPSRDMTAPCLELPEGGEHPYSLVGFKVGQIDPCEKGCPSEHKCTRSSLLTQSASPPTAPGTSGPSGSFGSLGLANKTRARCKGNSCTHVCHAPSSVRALAARNALARALHPVSLATNRLSASDIKGNMERAPYAFRGRPGPCICLQIGRVLSCI